MRDCIILGSGRSGTSMVAGTLAKCGYFMGERLLSATTANPKGFFEDEEINSINEDVIARVIPTRPPIIGRWLFRDRPADKQRWLARVPRNVEITCPHDLETRVRRLVERRPFCFKDPRFCYTLPAWRRFLGDAVFLCVFRHPAQTAESILRECRRAGYLRTLAMDLDRAVDVWTLMYQRVLGERFEGRWLFLHYEQVLSDEGLTRISEFLETDIDRGFPDRSLGRTRSDLSITQDASDLYEELCRLSGFASRA